MKRRKKRRGLWILLLILCVAYIYCTEEHDAPSPELTEYTVSPNGLPQEFSGFKIVQLSDLHGAKFGAELADMVREQSPDMIALTGDLITNAEDIEVIKPLLSELAEISDVYFVSGNHDYASDSANELISALEGVGIINLGNDSTVKSRNGEKLVIAGVEDPNSWSDLTPPDEFIASLRKDHPDECVVLLGHRNYWVTEYPELPVELILCGHEHGGIIRIPGVGGLLSHDRGLFPKYDAGAFESGSYTMIVSRGLGNSIPIPRIFNRPEIVSVTLR